MKKWLWIFASPLPFLAAIFLPNLSYESYEYLEETAGYFNVQFLKEIFQRRQEDEK